MRLPSKGWRATTPRTSCRAASKVVRLHSVASEQKYAVLPYAFARRCRRRPSPGRGACPLLLGMTLPSLPRSPPTPQTPAGNGETAGEAAIAEAKALGDAPVVGDAPSDKPEELPKPLAEVLNQEEGEEEAQAFADRSVNARSKRLNKAFAEKRTEVGARKGGEERGRALAPQVQVQVQVQA